MTEFCGTQPDYITIQSFLAWCDEEKDMAGPSAVAPKPTSPEYKLAQQIVLLMEPPDWFGVLTDVVDSVAVSGNLNERIGEFFKKDFINCFLRAYNGVRVGQEKTLDYVQEYIDWLRPCDKCGKMTKIETMFDGCCKKCNLN